MVVFLAAVGLALVRILPVGISPTAKPLPACQAPVQLDTSCGSRVVCAGDAVLAPCGALGAGARAYLARGECFPIEGGMRGEWRLVYGQKLDLNRSSVKELTLLPGIGPTRAQKIVRERARRGRFGAVRELLTIEGIGPATFAKLEDLVTVFE